MKGSRKRNPQQSKSSRLTGKQEEALVRLLNRTKVEMKYIDNTVTASAPTWAGLMTAGAVIPQGAATSQRVGDSLRIKELDISWQLVNNAANTTMTRLLLFVDKNGVLGTISDVLENIGTAISPLSPIKTAALPLMTILYDEVVTTDSVWKGQVVARLKFKLNLLQTYKPTTTNLVENAIRLIALPDTLAAPPTMDIYMRQWYTDE